MKKKKGFTLIELLAVIVILAIIALIATPAIINVIENARKKAFEDTSYGVLEGLRLDYTERVMTNTTSMEKTFTFPNSGLKLSGEEPAYGTAKIDSKGNISFALADKDKRWCAKKESNSEKVTIEDYTEENCKIDGTSSRKCNTVSFATDSWETIACAVKNNELDKYKVGDEKEVAVNGYTNGSESTFTVRIANTSTPAECNEEKFSQSACGFVVKFVDIITNAAMNSGATNSGGWPASEVSSLVNTTIYNALPEDLKKVIIDTKVISVHGYQSEEIDHETTDKLYLLGIGEVFKSYDNMLTRQPDFYKNLEYPMTSSLEAKKQYQNSNSIWWLRTSIYSNSFNCINNFGGLNTCGAEENFGVAPAFRIG